MMKLETCQELLETTDLRTVVSAVAMRAISSRMLPTVRELEGQASFTARLEQEYRAATLTDCSHRTRPCS